MKTKLRKILASEGLVVAPRMRVASAPTALAKFISTVPTYESVSSRDAMEVAKQLIKTLISEIRAGVKKELVDDLAPYPEPTDVEEGSYAEPTGGDYYEYVDFEYPTRMKMEVGLRIDFGGAGLSSTDDGWLDEEELYEALGESRLWKSIVKDAFKGVWRKGLQKEAWEAFDYRADEALEEHVYPLRVEVKEGTYKPFNVTYQVTNVDLDRYGTMEVELVLGASFNEPELEPR